MPPKKKASKLAVKHDPLMLGQQPLLFDGMDVEELKALTPDQEATKFLVRWMEIVDPFVEFKDTFMKGDIAADRLLLEVKRHFKSFVLEKKWTERKYVLVINNIFETKSGLFEKTIEMHGKIHDHEDLLSQRRIRRQNARQR